MGDAQYCRHVLHALRYLCVSARGSHLLQPSDVRQVETEHLPGYTH